MTRQMDLPTELELPATQKEALDQAWRLARAREHGFDFLGRPNHLTAAMAKAIAARVSDSPATRDELIEAALQTLPKRKARAVVAQG